MPTDRSILLEHINTAIKRNSCKNENGHIVSDEKSLPLLTEFRDREYFPDNRNKELLKKLERRIEALETQNDRLLYFIHFLYKNFPELVRDIIPENNYPEEKSFQLNNGNAGPNLTPREIEVLHLLLKGLCAKEIANQLFISETTVITHKKNLKEKFCAKNTAELISKAFNLTMRG